ncbi:MurR/RpiR family transcriptional regulator [Trinickia fusca]|uniref:MurR/RpiR family transcriptional regulator n=1 Tax=Trinickia fusca TaxID=2419777 RepID=A0A494XF26_9BURK|nr:MurR/RpiR family transcriptional regulator [Trinickia fusca]
MVSSSVRVLLQHKHDTFTVAEKRVIGVLLANYPSAALTSISNLACQAGVSDPTVHRLVVKLGFEGYPEFQKALLAEVDERMNSPLSMLETAAYAQSAVDLDKAMLGSLAVSVGKTAEHATRHDFEQAVALLADMGHAVYCCGGRASGFLASRLVTLLCHLRPRARHIEPSLERAHEVLVDIDAGDVLVVYDYRRYQESVVQFAQAAHARGARILLFTDEWRSPIASFAETVLVSFAQTASPFDTKVPALAQSESLIAALVQRLPDQAKARLQRIEALRSADVDLPAKA